MSLSSFYLFVDSDSDVSKSYFPNNSPINFKVHLKEPLQLDHIWKVALTDIRLKDSNKIVYTDDLYVLCDLVGESIVNGIKQESFLRKVQCVRKGNWTHVYDSPHYMNINKTQIFDIEFYILDNDFKPPSFLKKPVSLTVHFRQYPFFA